MPAVNINKQYSTSHTGIYFHMQQECRLNLKPNTYICTQLHIYKTCSLLAIRILKGFCAIFSHTVQHRESYEGPLSHRCRLALNEVPVTDAAVTLFESKPITLCLVKPSFRGKTRSLRSRQKKIPSLLFYIALPCCVDNITNHPWDKNEFGIAWFVHKKKWTERPEEMVTFPQGNVSYFKKYSTWTLFFT